MISGDYCVAYGNVYDKSKGVELVPGSVQINPKGVRHYEWTPSGGLLMLASMGPWSTTYVDSQGKPI